MKSKEGKDTLDPYEEYLIRRINQNKIDWLHPLTIMEILTFVGYLIFVIYLFISKK